MKRAASLIAVGLLALATAADAQWRASAVGRASASPLSDPLVFTAYHDPLSGAGDLVARRAGDPAGTPARWHAASWLDALPDTAIAERRVFSADEQQRGLALHWPALMPPVRSQLTSVSVDERRLDAVRGDRRAAAERPPRSRLGAILNSNVWHAGRATDGFTAANALVLIGANDGMLHALDAEHGREQFAYVPRGVWPQLARLAQTDGERTHTVDGPLFSASVPVGTGGARRHVLVGALGAGGKGFYVLDITPSPEGAPRAPSELVLIDRSAEHDADLGQIYAPPVLDEADGQRSRQIVQLNNRRWAAVMGNGYFSARGRPVLLIQYLDGARELARLSPCAEAMTCAFAGDNGLSPPRLIDVNGDGRIDIAYAGDLQGHLWKFDLTGTSPNTDWRVAFAGQPFFTARDALGRRQPITTAPYWLPHPQGGVMLALGTGRHLQREDTVSLSPQSLYGLHDRSTLAATASGVALVDGPIIASAAVAPTRPRSLVPQRYTLSASVQGIDYFDASELPTEGRPADGAQGWWIDLPLAGQRVLHHPMGFEGQKILVQSLVPAAPTPDVPQRPWDDGARYLSVLNLFTGRPPAQPAFDAPSTVAHPETLGMVSLPPGPALLWRAGTHTEWRPVKGASVTLRQASTRGVRTGWRERR